MLNNFIKSKKVKNTFIEKSKSKQSKNFKLIK